MNSTASFLAPNPSLYFSMRSLLRSVFSRICLIFTGYHTRAQKSIVRCPQVTSCISLYVCYTPKWEGDMDELGLRVFWLYPQSSFLAGLTYLRQSRIVNRGHKVFNALTCALESTIQDKTALYLFLLSSLTRRREKGKGLNGLNY